MVFIGVKRLISEDKIIECLQQTLSKKRYDHSIHVANMAVELAQIYGSNIDKARIAGLIHDCAREMPNEKLIELIRLEGNEPDSVSLVQKELLHGPAAIYLCKNKFFIEDEEILSAVQFHTTGKANMTMLDKIIYISDMIEVGREFPGVKELRNLAIMNINSVLLKSFDATISYLIQKQRMIHPDTINARNYLIRNLKSGDGI